MDRSALRHLRPSGKRSAPAASTMHALLDFCTDRNFPPARGSLQDSYGAVQRKLTAIKDKWVRCTPSVDFVAYSIVEVDLSILDDDGRLELTVIPADEHTQTYAVNEVYPLYANAPGWVRLVGYDDFYVVRANQSMFFGDRVQHDADGVLKYCLLSDLVVAGGSKQAGAFYMTPVRLEPVHSWLGVSRAAGGINESGDVEVGSSGEKRNVYYPFGEFEVGSPTWVSRGIGVGEEGPTSRWVGVQRPCPGDFIS